MTQPDSLRGSQCAICSFGILGSDGRCNNSRCATNITLINKSVATIGRRPQPPVRKNDMSSIRQCERCGSIGRGRGFATIRASRDEGYGSITVPLLSDTEGELQDAPEICVDCQTDLIAFFQNEAVQPREARPIIPKKALQSAQEPEGETP